ncbi:DUF4133 domain-containing protein [Cytophagaceae bacterium YF14B1]|uniref:DUF4133 domain-containing protein n=1 Tax=Xanthocytophaga flava TaxID=3048013 RepID=A0AAE3QL12_9BACT|nr:DUF4133 domain-containing protein [Xanthocytophaga flavus]MDJ1478841.1 DUF4133 domain-containing protein [Xanthocytophaga flavus]
MTNSVYTINKGINKSIEFKGLKAQYIWYLGAGIVALLVLYALFYFVGLNTFISLGIILILGAGITFQIYKLSNTYGEYGLMKKIARRQVTNVIKSYNRDIFLLKKAKN